MTPQTRHTTLMVVIILLLAGILGVLLYPRLQKMVEKPVPVTTTKPTPTDTQKDMSDEIVITYPMPNVVVKSPMNLMGKARGSWYFEGNMVSRVEDATGKGLGMGHLTAEGEWMTKEFVPFGGVIEFKPSPTPTGWVVFQNDNPTGLAQYNKEFRVPVKFFEVQ